MSIDFGELVGSENAQVLVESDLPGMSEEQDPQGVSTATNPLWEYHELGTINGVQVNPDARNLNIDTLDKLLVALQLQYRPKVFVCWISPDDEAGMAAYTALLDRVSRLEIVIDEETRQYDPGKSAYMVFVRYSEISYGLHPRFNYLRGEQ